MENKEVIKILSDDLGIEFETCESSNIVAYGYDEPNKYLWVIFKNHAIYRYNGITKEYYSGLQNAESKGKWVNQNLVKNKDIEFEAYILK